MLALPLQYADHLSFAHLYHTKPPSSHMTQNVSPPQKIICFPEMKTGSNQGKLVGGYFPRLSKKGQYKGNTIEYGDPRKKLESKGRTLKRTQTIPSSATRRARPQNPSSFRLVKMASGECITIASHVEPDNFKREQPDMYTTRYGGIRDTQRLASGILSPTMKLTANDRTERSTGPSNASVNYTGAPHEPWMRGNTRRFGNKGLPWVANSRPSCGGAPGISEEQVSSWSMNTIRGPSFSNTSLAANAFSPHTPSSLPSIRGMSGAMRS